MEDFRNQPCCERLVDKSLMGKIGPFHSTLRCGDELFVASYKHAQIIKRGEISPKISAVGDDLHKIMCLQDSSGKAQKLFFGTQKGALYEINNKTMLIPEKVIKDDGVAYPLDIAFSEDKKKIGMTSLIEFNSSNRMHIVDVVDLESNKLLSSQEVIHEQWYMRNDKIAQIIALSHDPRSMTSCFENLCKKYNFIVPLTQRQVLVKKEKSFEGIKAFIYDVKTGNYVNVAPLRGVQLMKNIVVDDKYFVVASDSAISIWDLESGNKKIELEVQMGGHYFDPSLNPDEFLVHSVNTVDKYDISKMK